MIEEEALVISIVSAFTCGLMDGLLVLVFDGTRAKGVDLLLNFSVVRARRFVCMDKIGAAAVKTCLRQLELARQLRFDA